MGEHQKEISENGLGCINLPRRVNVGHEMAELFCRVKGLLFKCPFAPQREKFQHRSGIFFKMEKANVSVGVGKNIPLLPPVSKIGWKVKTRLVFNVFCLSLALVLFA